MLLVMTGHLEVQNQDIDEGFALHRGEEDVQNVQFSDRRGLAAVTAGPPLGRHLHFQDSDLRQLKHLFARSFCLHPKYVARKHFVRPAWEITVVRTPRKESPCG